MGSTLKKLLLWEQILSFERKFHFGRSAIFRIVNRGLCPVVQCPVSLTKSLVQDLLRLTVLTKSVVVAYFAEKNEGSFCTAKAPLISSDKK